MKRNFTKLIAAFALLMFLIPLTGWGQTWEKTAPADLTTDDIIVVVDLTSGKAMSNNNGTSSAPSAIAVTLNTTNDQITSEVGETIQWTLITSGSGDSRTYQLANGTNYLYVTATNNGVRVGSGTRNTFTIVSGGENNGYYLYNVDGTDNRYVGCYSASDWRCYTTINNNIKINNIAFFKKITGGGGTPTPTVATPTFNPAGGTYTAAQSVTISCTTEDATIYYTLDGNNPTTSSNVYSEALNIEETTTVKAMAVKENYNNSAIAEATYTIVQPVTGYTIDFENAASFYSDWTFTNMESQQTSAIDAHGGTYYGTTGGKATASIQTEKPVATLNSLTCYVSKQSTNTTASSWYIQVSSDGNTWTDVATRSATDMSKGEWKEFTADLSAYSNVYVRVYYSGSTAVRNIDDLTLDTSAPAVAAPTFSPANGTEFGDEGLEVTITCATEGASIYYTLDGSDPTDASTAYNGAINLTTTTTVKAIAYVGTVASSVASATYTYVDPNAPGSENNPYTVAEARAAIDAGTGVTGVYATGIVSEIVTPLNTQYGNITYNISTDGTTTAEQLQAYRGKSYGGDWFTSEDDIQVGDIVVVYGNLTKYGETYEFAQDNQLVSLVRPSSDEPSITVTPNPVQISGEAGSGSLTVTYHKVHTDVELVDYIWCNADGSTPATENYENWLTIYFDEEDATVLNYMVGDNEEDHTAYFKILGLAEDTNEEVYSDVVTFTQLGLEVDYAYLPYEFNGGRADIENENGLTQNGLGTDYAGNNPKLKFDGAGDYLVLKINPNPLYEYSPKAITFNIKGNGFSGGTFAVQVSEDGETYTDLATYDELGDTQTVTLLNTNDNVKYIRWNYIYKDNGNVGIGNIYVDDEYLVRGNATVSEDLTLAACEIKSEGKLTIESGATFEVTEPYALYNGGNSTNLVIKDGGQLKTPNAVFATVEKNIIGYTAANVNTNKGYYLVSAPAEKYLYVASSNADVDAYMFDASEEGEEWRNFKGAQGAWNISASSAILYATKENSTLSLDGYGIVYNNQSATPVNNKVPATITDIEIDIRFNSGKAFEGYNLIGNPFTCTAYLADSRDFLRMNEDGDGFVWTSGAISVCEGIFVVAESTNDNSVTFTTTNPTDGNAGPAALTLNLTQSRGNVIDNARIRFGEGCNYAKFALNESNARVSFTQGNKEYSLVRSNGQGEMPVSFKAAQNGTYTLSFDMENVAFDNLRLIDNLTGVETDLLAAPSYTFTARTTDYASRFRLVFSANNVNQNAENDTFAYFNGSEWVINGSDNATVQVIDMMGRVVLSGTNTIATNDMQAGVYVIRLVDGNNVKTQKIVVQ